MPEFGGCRDGCTQIRTRPSVWALSIILVAVASAVLAVSIAEEAMAVPNPPASGNWTIDVGEVVTHEFATLDLRGDLHIRGTLELDNTTLWVWLASDNPRVLTVHPGGTLRGVTSSITRIGTGRAFILRAEVGSTLELDRFAFVGAGDVLNADGRTNGVYVATDATLVEVNFLDCLTGLWVSGSDVTARDCEFVDCNYGAVASAGSRLTIEGGTILRCDKGTLCNSSFLSVEGVTVTECNEGLLAYGGNLTVSGTTAVNCSRLAVGSYSANLTMVDSTVRDADADGVIVHTSRAILQGCLFDNLTRDVNVIRSEVWIQSCEHRDTYDEALWLFHSTFHINNMTVVGSHWALRGFRSTGECRDLRSINASYAVHLEQCSEVLVERLYADGGYSRPFHTSPRGILVIGGPVTIRDAVIFDMRTGIDLTGAMCTIERVRVDNCTREGVIVSLSWEFVMREVNVTRCLDGFRLNLFSGGRLERCTASYCRETGFNYTAGARTLMQDCNISSNHLGLRTFYASPVLRNCTVWQCDNAGVPVNTSLGVQSLNSSPDIRGGLFLGGHGGIFLNHSRAYIRNVTFVNLYDWAIEFVESYHDVVEGCRIINSSEAYGMAVYMSTPVLRDNYIYKVNYGINVFTGSAAIIEGNHIENVTYDGLTVIDNASVVSRNNFVRDCGWWAVHVMLYSSLISRDDEFRDSGSNLVKVWLASSLDMQGSKLINASSSGIAVKDCLSIRVTNCEFRDSNRGMLVTKGRELSPSTTVFVEGCYFTNHSSYAIGIFEGYLSVSDCSFLDNIAGIHLDNVTADLRDCTLVGSWLFGLLSDNSTARWTVDGRCKIISSDILGRVQFTMTSGDLWIEDCLVDITSSSYFKVKGATTVTMSNVRWESDGAAVSIASTGRVDLYRCVFVGVGPIVGGSPGTFGVVLRDCDVGINDCRFLRARAGLSLVRCTATVVDTRIAECSSFGLFARDSNVDLQSTMVNRTVIGDGIHVEGSTLHASASVVVSAVNTLFASGSEVHMTNCSMGGAEVSSVVVAEGRVTLVNTTHDQERVRASDNGSVDVWWYVSTRVLWSDPTDLVTSTVSVLDIEGATVASGHPDARGILPNLLVLSIWHFPETLDLRGPLTVGVDHRGYLASTVVNLNSSIWVTLLLDDVDPPVFDIQSHPSSEIWVRDRALDIWGVAVDNGSGTEHVEAKLDYSPSPWMAQGSAFAFTVTMTDGRHVIELMAVDNFGNEARAILIVHVETRSILLTPPDPMNGTVTNAATVLVRGRLSRIEDVNVTVNRVPAQLDTANKSYSLPVDLVEGMNNITVRAEDVYGHWTAVWTLVMADWTPPMLSITSPIQVNTTEEWVAVTGSADANARVTIQGSSVLLRDGAFSVRYPVYLCETLVVIRAEDGVGNSREVEVLVFREDPDIEIEERSPWEVLPFILAIPILVVVVWYVLRPKDLRSEGGAAR